MAVDCHWGPFSMAETTLPIQLSPVAMEVPLCWEVEPLGPLAGMSSEKLGSVPFLALVMTLAVGTMLLASLVYRQSAKVGQVSQM